MTGADAATVLGGFTVRAEAAYFEDRPYLRDSRDLIRESRSPAVVRRYLNSLGRPRFQVPIGELFPSLDSVEWGVGADYCSGLAAARPAEPDRAARAPRVSDPRSRDRLSGTLRKHLLAERLSSTARHLRDRARGRFVFRAPRISCATTSGSASATRDRRPRAPRCWASSENDEFVLQARTASERAVRAALRDVVPIYRPSAARDRIREVRLRVLRRRRRRADARPARGSARRPAAPDFEAQARAVVDDMVAEGVCERPDRPQASTATGSATDRPVSHASGAASRCGDGARRGRATSRATPMLST
jgi:hypothetical protein